ncbi:MAG TPA: hypothetical protein VFP81_06195 [Propionibacteriaceae bacterium]|nr:hypothetical protein [Propionibacteriaceae bacterium]
MLSIRVDDRSLDDGASSMSRNAPGVHCEAERSGLGRDEFVDEVFNPAAALVTDGSDGNWAANP